MITIEKTPFEHELERTKKNWNFVMAKIEDFGVLDEMAMKYIDFSPIFTRPGDIVNIKGSASYVKHLLNK